MSCKYAAVLLCLILIPIDAKEMVVSYVKHPQIQRYSDLIEASYSDIGISIKLVELPLARRLIALNDGIIDADVVGVDIKGSKENVIRVEPPLYDIQAILVCKLDLPCSDQVLNNREIRIYVDSGLITFMERSGVLTRKRNVMTFNRLDALLELMLLERVDYFVMALDPKQPLSIGFTEKINMHSLSPLKVYHHIHSKHRHIVPSLGESIQKNMSDKNAAVRLSDFPSISQ